MKIIYQKEYSDFQKAFTSYADNRYVRDPSVT